MSGVRHTVRWAKVSRFVTAGAIAVALVACSGSSKNPGGGGGTAVLTGDPAVVVAGSAQRTTAARNAKVDLTGNVAVGGQTTTLNGTGAIDFEKSTFQLNVTLPGMGSIEERFVDQVVYVKIPAGAMAEFGGKPWLRIDPNAFGGAAGANPLGSLGTSNPSQILNTLQGAGKVTRVGDDTVRGVHTVHYRADIDIAKAADKQGLTPEQKQQLQQALGGQSTVPEDVWLDDQGLVRRLAVDINASPSTGTSRPSAAKTRIQAEFYDYGKVTQPVTAPPADQVTDFSQIIGQLGQLGQFGSFGGSGTTS